METLMKDTYSACEHLSENWQHVERIFQGPETGQGSINRREHLSSQVCAIIQEQGIKELCLEHLSPDPPCPLEKKEETGKTFKPIKRLVLQTTSGELKLHYF